MTEERDYIEPVTVERDSVEQSEKPIENNETVDKTDSGVINEHEVYDSDDPRKAIAAKHARKQREELGIEEATKPEPDAEDDPLITVKVLGKERQVKQSKIDAAGGLDVYQKRLAAEDRLQEVSLQKKQLEASQTRLQREAEEFKRWQQQQIERLAQERQSLAARAGTQPSAQPQQGPKPDPAIKDLVRQHREALFDGDDDKADELMIKIQSYGARPPAPAVNVQEIEQRTYQRIQARLAQEQAARERTTAQQDFATQYNDIVGDDRLFQMADQETIRLKSQNPSWSDRQIIMQAGHNVRQWREKMMGVERQAQPQTDFERAQAKRAMSAAKAASGRNPSRPEPKPQTPSQYIESLKAARGQM